MTIAAPDKVVAYVGYSTPVGISFVFVNACRFSKRQTLDETKYLRLFTDEFQPVISKDINGSLFCDDVLDENDKPIKHGLFPPQGRMNVSLMKSLVSWACYKIKHVRDPHTYEWVQTTVFVTWYPETQIQVVFIVDHPDPPSKLVAILPTNQANSNPYVWHAVIANTMVGAYDHSFWALRDLVRATEKVILFRSKITMQYTKLKTVES